MRGFWKEFKLLTKTSCLSTDEHIFFSAIEHLSTVYIAYVYTVIFDVFSSHSLFLKLPTLLLCNTRKCPSLCYLPESGRRSVLGPRSPYVISFFVLFLILYST